jgi:hypothetical protein
MIRSFFFLLVAIILFVLFAPVAFLVNIIRKPNRAEYLFNIAIGIDQLGGSVLYNQPDWTVSSWTYYQSSKHKEHYYFMKLIDSLFGKDHCYKSFVNEMKEFKKAIEVENITFLK